MVNLYQHQVDAVCSALFNRFILPISIALYIVTSVAVINASSVFMMIQ